MEKFIKHKDKDTYINYCKLRNQVRWETRHAQKEFEMKIAASVKQQPKLFWSKVQSKSKTKSGICDLTYFEDNIKLSATTDKRKAEVLACCCCCCRPHSTNVLPAESSTRIMWQPTVSPPRWQGKAPLCRDSSRGPG